MYELVELKERKKEGKFFILILLACWDILINQIQFTHKSFPRIELW